MKLYSSLRKSRTAITVMVSSRCIRKYRSSDLGKMIEISLLLAVEDIGPGPKKVGLRFVVDHEDKGQKIIINAITRGRGLRRKFTIYYVQRKKHRKLDFTGVLTYYEPGKFHAGRLEELQAQALISVDGKATWTI